MNKIIQATILALSLMLGLQLSAEAATPTANPETAGQYVSSSAVTAKVKAALVQTPGLSAGDINVKTHKGRVFLNGVVPSKDQSQLAEQAAAGVVGANNVENNLVVKK